MKQHMRSISRRKPGPAKAESLLVKQEEVQLFSEVVDLIRSILALFESS